MVMYFNMVIYGHYSNRYTLPRRLSHVKASVVLTRAAHLLYTQLYKIASKYYFKTYCIGEIMEGTRIP